MYSWGQIRLLLQQFAPGVSLDLIDEKINGRYAMILGLKQWKGLEKSAVLETTAAIETGTINVTNGSAAVSGTATGWTAAITGMQLLVPACGGPLYTVTYVDATDLTLDRPFEGTTATASGYTLLQSIYQLPIDCGALRTIASPVTGLALDELTEVQFAELIGLPTLTGVATSYIPQPDYVDPTTGETYQQIQLYPLPRLARGYPLVYEQQTAGFDGVSTANGPLSFVSDAAILAGAKADLSLERKDYAGAAAWETLYQKHLTTMLHADNLRRAPQPIRLDPRYTQHRTDRILRSFGARILNSDGI